MVACPQQEPQACQPTLLTIEPTPWNIEPEETDQGQMPFHVGLIQFYHQRVDKIEVRI